MSLETLYGHVHDVVETDPRSDLPPIAVSLAKRAVALASIMEYLNKVSSAKGSKIQAENPDSSFSKRYPDRAAKVQQGAEKNAAELRDGFERGLHTLAATDALSANGYDEEEVERERMLMQIAINRQFGVGNADADIRAAAVKRAHQYPGSGPN
jgi:hypothetical protein